MRSIIICLIVLFTASIMPAGTNFESLGRQLSFASAPTKFFFVPTARVLSSMEVSFSGGSSYGVEESSGLLARFGLGLGGVAEMEFSTQQVANQLTGEETRFPSRMFKVQVVPERFTDLWFVPNIAVQLRTTSWGSVVSRDQGVTAALEERFRSNYSDLALQSLQLSTRFTTLYAVAGKDFSLGGIHLGASLTDVRTREGGQWILDNKSFRYDYYRFPEVQKNILQPFGGLYINANESTRIMAEVSALPNYSYNIQEKTIDITHAWAGIGGVRFFMYPWLSWDAGVRYLSSYDGIADAEISIAMNLVLPVKRNRID